MIRRWFVPNSSIQNRFWLSTLLLILIPLGIFGLITLQISKNSIESHVSQSNLKTLGQISEKTDMLLDDIIAVSNTFYLNPQVNNALSAQIVPNSYEEAMLRTSFNQLFSNSMYSFGRLRYQVTLLGQNGLEFTTIPLNKDIRIQDIVNRQWYKSSGEESGRILWITDPIPGLAPPDGDQRYFHAVRSSNQFESGNLTGLVIISVEESTMQSLYKGSLDDKQDIVIVNDAGVVISSKNPALQAANLTDRSYFDKIYSYDSGYFIDRELGAKQLISFQTVGKTGWKLVSYSPVSTVLASINQIQRVETVVFVLVAILSFIASYVMARRLAIPVKRLYKHFGQVEAGNLAVRSPVTGKDEIGQLTGKFNQMVANLETLMEDVKREQQMKRHAELQALQSQINPHFLYNTLASIRFMLHKQSVETVDSVIVSLVKLLKVSLSKQDEWVPVREELEIVRNYLHIQQIRQGDKLRVEYELDEDIYPYRTVKFLLQPLVENAIFHGIEPKQGDGVIHIRGRVEKQDIIFEVEDDGVGMDIEREEALAAPGADGFLSHGGGCRNVHERIRMHFGPEYGLSIRSVKGRGTIATVRIPALYKREEGVLR